ncbi:hypothetical protein H663_020505 [Limnohabitans planktonicus II-D5]|uniref:Uncharacterized protein n=1 Tax=Limnohabitans planktonicus II-D5 TaxID=1293045 RepID=A0A2T7SQV6_9BURK|nr:hypothetical protein H663_020505 [Limnohabitans planktonicus II-D5]
MQGLLWTSSHADGPCRSAVEDPDVWLMEPLRLLPALSVMRATSDSSSTDLRGQAFVMAGIDRFGPTGATVLVGRWSKTPTIRLMGLIRLQPALGAKRASSDSSSTDLRGQAFVMVGIDRFKRTGATVFVGRLSKTPTFGCLTTIACSQRFL